MISITLPRRNRKSSDVASPFFDVKDVPSLRGDTMAPTGDRYIVNADTNVILGKVSKGYQITTHKEASDMVKGFLADMNLPFEQKFAKSSNKGSRFFETLTFPQFTTNLASFTNLSTALDTRGLAKDEVVPSLIIRNSYDKSAPVSFEYGLFRIVCANGMVRPVSANSVTKVAFRHNSVINADTVRDSILENLEKSNKLIEHAYSQLNVTNGLDYLNKMLNAPALSDTFKKSVLDKLAGHVELDFDVKVTPQERGEKVEWLIKKVDTNESAWSIYNAVTEVSTHQINSQAERVKSDKVIAQLFLADIE